MKNSKLILTSLLLLIFTISNAQQIFLSGKVLSTQQEPVEFANVLLKNTKEGSLPFGSITNADGSFKIEVPEQGVYELKISFVGYTEKVQTISVDKSVDIENIILEEEANTLGEVVVVGKLKIIERKEDKLIFNIQASPLKSGFDGMEVLARSPNVWVDENGGIQMRNESATILINGRAPNLSGANLTNYISNLRSDDIKAIEIQTHLSANTDAESSGGVINIILKKKAVGFDGNIRSVYTFKTKGDYNNQNNFNFNYGAEKWNVYGSYSYQQSTSESENNSSIDYFTSQNFLGEKGGLQRFVKRHNYQLGFVADPIENHVMGFEFFATNFESNYDNISLVDILNNGESIDNGIAQLIGDVDNDVYNVTFNYKWTLDTLKSNLKFFADYASSDVGRFNDAISSYEQGFYTGITERNDGVAGTNIYGLQADLEKYFQNGLKLELGSKLSNTQRENALLSEILIGDEWIPNQRTRSFDYDEQVSAGYISVSKKIKEDYFLKIGVRTEHTNLERKDLNQDSIIQQNYTDWFPSFYLSRDLPKDNTISISYSKRLRRPSFQLLNNYVIKINDFRFELGNPELRPEYVNNYELSFKQKRQTFDLYYQKTREAVNGIYFLEGDVSFYKKFNDGSQTQFGLSYNRFGNLYKWWFIRASLGVYNRKFTEESGIDNFQRSTGYVSLNNNFKLNKTTSLELRGYYRSKHEDAYYIAAQIYDVNLMLQKTFFNKKLSARIYLSDIFNTLIYENERPFATFKSSNSHKPQTRNIRLWISYNFSGKNKATKRKNRSKNEATRRL